MTREQIIEKLKSSADYHERIAEEALARKSDDFDTRSLVSDQHAYAAQVLRDIIGEVEDV